MLSQLRRIRAKGCKTCVAFHGVKKVWMPSSIDWPIDGDEMPCQKDLKGKFQKMQTAKTKPVKISGGCCAKDTCGPRGQTCSKREGSGLHPYRTGRSHGAEDKNVQNREVLYQNENNEDDFSWSISSTGSKKLKRRKGVWQAMSVMTVKTLMRAIDGFP